MAFSLMAPAGASGATPLPDYRLVPAPEWVTSGPLDLSRVDRTAPSDGAANSSQDGDPVYEEGDTVVGLSLNEIGRVTLRTTQPLFYDEYRRNRTTGSFILVDEATNVTVGAGMILAPLSE